MASKGRTRKTKKRGKGKGPDLEAIGLVLLALGLFVLVVLIPSLPSGELGATLRAAVLGRVGWGGYVLPGPLLVLGALFFVRRSPKGWPRVLAGYGVAALGAWALLMLVRPEWTGGWGRDLRALLTGAAGWLAAFPAVLIVLLGVELVLGWRPTRIARGVLVRGVEGAGRIGRAALAARARARERAAFHADVALARGALQELDKDLEALRALYPGSAELERWRSAIRGTLKSLAQPTAEALADARMDIEAWREAVRDFARDRAAELAVHLKAEGIPDFDAWAHGVKAQLDDPITDPVRPARPLDDVRKTLALDLTALAERYRRLTRERDLAEGSLSELCPRELAKASEQHLARLAAYRGVQDDADALETDADALEPWRALMPRLLRLASEFPTDEEVVDLSVTLAKELREHGRALLGQHEGWGEALEAVELRARERALRAAAAPAAEPDDEVDAETPGEDGPAPGGTPEAGAEAPAEPRVEEAGLEPAAAADGELPPFEPLRFPERFVDDDLAPWEERPDPAPVPAAVAAASAAPAAGEPRPAPEVGGIPIQVPGLDLLDVSRADHEDPTEQAREVQGRVRKIDETLANFRLEGRVVSSVRGPTVTRFEVEPAPGEKISRFANLSDDLALAMAVGSVRIEAPIPGKSVIGLEVPNEHRDLINFRLAVEAPSFRRSKARLPMILGKSIDGEMVVADLAKMPHLLIAGSTGSGKSVAVNTLIGSLIYKFLPTELRFLMIDPKMVELTPYDGIPHLLRPVVTNPNDASGVLLGAVAHMERRYKMMSKIGAKNLDQYNEKARNLDLPEMPFIAIIIDELADLMITSPKEVESAIMRLAQMARATGMHLILATQRPSVDILTSLIKVNVPARMAFAVSSSHDSRTILDSMGAERLVGMGDMLFYQPGLVKPTRLQGPFISEDEIVKLASFLRRQYFDDEFVEAYGSDFDPPSLHDSDASGLIDWNDDKLRDAAELVINEGQASVSRLQRRLQVGHARAGKLMDSLEALGVVGPHQGSKPREVLVEYEELPNLFGK